MKALIVFLFTTISFKSFTQTIYGNNAAAGHYLNVGDANIYYEIYGSGKPVVLLHSGTWGYIDDYKDLIPVLSKKYQVIAIATKAKPEPLAVVRFEIGFLSKLAKIAQMFLKDFYQYN